MVLPTVTGVLLTGSSWMESFLICYVIKHVLVSQLSSLLNSAAHLFGDKPYNTKIMACDDKVLASFTVGEGYHKLVFTQFFPLFHFFCIFPVFFLYFPVFFLYFPVFFPHFSCIFSSFFPVITTHSHRIIQRENLDPFPS